VTRELSYREALREALRGALREDDRVIVLGQDVGARGGSYGVTAGLLEDFGAGRVLDAPSSEAAVVGVAIGAAMTGLRPVVELTTATFAGLAYDQLAHHAAPLRAMSGGRVTAPFVLRMPQSAGGRLGPVHSSNVEALLHHIPGLTVWAPSSPGDAFAMLGAAIRVDDPVVLLEHTLLYDTTGPVDEDAEPGPFGAATRREGDDVTLVATSRMVGLALAAAQALADEGIEACVVDLRALRPLDESAIVDAATRTGRAVLIEEGPPAGGITATLAALLPRCVRVQRVTGADAPVPYAASLEAAALPSAERIAEAARALLVTDRPGEDRREPAAPPASGPAFTTTAPVDVESLLATHRATATPLATLLADALADLLPTAIIATSTDTTILGHPAPGPSPATLALGPITTRPTVADGAVTIRHIAPLTLTTNTHPDGDALFAAIRARLADN
jgi:pyruvate/2-oxoglutarate/acetoin dehydrogenase E1 component